MSTKGRSNRSRKGSTTPPPPVVETGREPVDPSAKTLAGPFAPGDETTAPPSAVAVGEAPLSKKRATRTRTSVAPKSRTSVPPKAPKKESARPAARSRRSKTPPPVAVADVQLALTPPPPSFDLTPAPTPVVVDGARVAPAPQPGLVRSRGLDETHVDPAPPATLEAGGWRAPQGLESGEHESHDDKLEAAPARDAMTSSPDRDPDDVSVPPAVEDLDHHFFAQPGPASHRAPSLHDTFSDLDTRAPDPLLAHRMSPRVQERRARLAKVVKAAVGIAAAVCFVAAAVHFGTRRTEVVAATTADKPVAATAPQGTGQETSAAAPDEARAEPEATAVGAAPEPVEAPKADDLKADEAKPNEAKPDEAKPDEAKAETAELDPELAKKEKRASQQALERYDLKKAIELGEQSVAHDPNDAEAWLILGAAYQTKGQMADAKRCFKACIDEGKGPRRWECYQFPH